MNDKRELLELAAKAAGINLHFVNGNPKEVTEHWPCDPTEGPQEREWDWNPLEDDGDALRLAVKLGLRVEVDHLWHRSHAQQIPGGEWVGCRHNVGPYTAARLAIVKAAAEIGRNMP